MVQGVDPPPLLLVVRPLKTLIFCVSSLIETHFSYIPKFELPGCSLPGDDAVVVVVGQQL